MGHATRCIPIVKALLIHNYTVLIASDGDALQLLQQTFPTLQAITLPSYKISYKNTFFGLKGALLTSAYYNYNNYKLEQKLIAAIIQKHEITGIISDNRFGVFNNNIPSVYITHQIRVLSGLTTYITSKLHQKIIAKYTECWIPDFAKKTNLSGKLSHHTTLKIPIKYIKPLSQFDTNCDTVTTNYDYCILLSGIEPLRNQLEEKLIAIFSKLPAKTILVQGKIAPKKTQKQMGNLTLVNYLLKEDLQATLCSSETIICRSGYSSIMDLQKLGKNVFFIPTPQQTEQEYLAKHLEKQQIAPFATQVDFLVNDLIQLDNYKGFNSKKYNTNWEELFEVFK